MENLDKLFTESAVTELSEKVLSATIEKIKDQLSVTFYNEQKNYLFEHYMNCSDEIRNHLIKDISEQYINDPANYKFKSLRDKIWSENKNEIISSLTDDAIKNNIEKVLLQYTHSDFTFNWQWKDGIVKLILSNWDKFKEDNRIQEQFGRELQRYKDQVKSLQSQLDEIRSITKED